jgi:type I restriction enzyme S subunit
MNSENNQSDSKMTEIGTIPVDWDISKLKDLTVENYRTINPAANPNEEFDYYSIPAYQENKKPSLEIGRRILSQKILLKNNAVLF